MAQATPTKLDNMQLQRLEKALDRIVQEQRAHNAIFLRLTEAMEKLVSDLEVPDGPS